MVTATPWHHTTAPTVVVVVEELAAVEATATDAQQQHLQHLHQQDQCELRHAVMLYTRHLWFPPT